jgi:hypothetical protein
MMQEKLPSASTIPVINQGFKLSSVDNSVVLIRHSSSLLLRISFLTIEEVEYLLQDILIGAKLNCLGGEDEPSVSSQKFVVDNR